MYKKYIKRLLDIIIALCCLPIFLITLVIVGPFIYLEDKGPIFYCAKRLGYHKKSFSMIKFRSMKVNAPDIRTKDNKTFNSEDDPRVTKVGKFLRKTSIDEIPQILNVLKGDMSIIGPRPNLDAKPHEDLSNLEIERLEVKPGITGFNQAYFRNSVDIIETFQNDVFYVRNISFLLDIKIILKTISTVLKRQNVYMKNGE